eukprot:5772728-Amphidinium_carterae.1
MEARRRGAQLLNLGELASMVHVWVSAYSGTCCCSRAVLDGVCDVFEMTIVCVHVAARRFRSVTRHTV